jgi:hypothetical protein
MADLNLFPKDQIIGVFRGFQEGGLEFHADLVFPYRNEFQSIPMHGQFLLVQLETPDEAVLGRITSFFPEGRLASGSGDEYNIRVMQDDRTVPEDLRERYLRYRINIRVLGVLRHLSNGNLTYVPSVRRLPHVGSPVAFPSGDVLREITGHNIAGAEIGHYALGEYVYAGKSDAVGKYDWMQIIQPEINVRFPIESLVSRRTFIFARAGFGKSNLNKLLFSKLYEKTPTVEKRAGRKVPVGTVIFDPDGEYFWPDDKGRPGLCDVPYLEDKLVVFTSRKNPSPFYQSFVAAGIKLDIRRLRPSDVISIALSTEKQDQQNVRKLRGLDDNSWSKLVDLIDREGNQASLDDIKDILRLEGQQDAEALAARANMTSIVKMLHDKSSQLMDMLIHSLSEGKLCIVDVSQMRGEQALVLSGLILRRIFDRNQLEFTEADPRTIPTIAVIEEAQSVLASAHTSSEPYIAWVKEGRKYDLGAVLVTQQPGSIPNDILSQGDNWFIFHLLSIADLVSAKNANAHFSNDILTAILNEPIQGQGVFWSSVGGKPYPVSVRVLSFEQMFKVVDAEYRMPAAKTFALKLHDEFVNKFQQEMPADSENPVEENEEKDVLYQIVAKAVSVIQSDEMMMRYLKADGVSWGKMKSIIRKEIPSNWDNADQMAYSMVVKVMNAIFGEQDKCWYSYKRVKEDGATVTTVKAGRKPD